mmetsp:Transcript_11831/g.14063  ORF Transcript_11831/g.14063 Transcript_11831/m.14063 type:complete len:111 (+) Transcript_11831:415-747(+)
MIVMVNVLAVLIISLPIALLFHMVVVLAIHPDPLVLDVVVGAEGGERRDKVGAVDALHCFLKFALWLINFFKLLEINRAATVKPLARIQLSTKQTTLTAIVGAVIIIIIP